MITEIDASLLEKIADLTGKPVGAFNIRKDMRLRGPSVHGAYRHRPPCRRQARYRHPLQRRVPRDEACHIPVIISQTGMNDMVYNDFFIVADDCDVHHRGRLRHPQLRLRRAAAHDGIHTFHMRQELPACATRRSTTARAPRARPASAS